MQSGAERRPKAGMKNCSILSEINALLHNKLLTALNNPFILFLSCVFCASSSKCLDTIS
jgi:hypothetical protein